MKNKDLKAFRTWGLPLLGLMAALFTISIIVTLVLHFWA